MRLEEDEVVESCFLAKEPLLGRLILQGVDLDRQDVALPEDDVHVVVDLVVESMQREVLVLP